MLAICALLFTARAAECGTESTLREVSDSYFPEDARTTFVRHDADVQTKHFDIAYGSNFKVVSNNYAKQQYVLTQCGTAAPDEATVNALAALPADFTRKAFTIPLQSWSSDSTGSLSFLDILGVHDRHKHVSQYASAPCLQKAMSCDETVKAVDSYTNATIQEMQKGMADAYFVDTADDHANTVAMTVAHDPSALNQAEWIKYVGAFFNQEDVAKTHMETVTKKWGELKAEGAAGANAGKVAVFIAHNDASAWGGSNALEISLAAYKTHLVAAAGGVSLDESTLTAASTHAVVSGSAADGNLKVKYDKTVPAAVEAFQAAIANAAVLIDETYYADPTGLDAAAVAAPFGTLAAPVYREDGLLSEALGLDWFEGRFARPDVLLQDFVAALHGTDAKRTYLRLPSEAPTIQTKADCAVELPICGAAAFAPIDTLYERYSSVADAVSDPVDSGAAAAMVALVALLLE
jgi:hypothetical protein